jgi:hypothetical protein
MNRRLIRFTGGAVVAALLTAACGMTSHHNAPAASMMNMTATSETKAAELRTALNALFGEHALLAASATGAALAGRDAQFKAVAASLDANSVDIAKAIGSVYGQGAQDAFLPLWRKHIGFVVDYTTGLATKDKAKQDKAVTDLVQYTQDFGAFLSSANPNLPMATVADLVKSHVLTLKDVIDAQATGDQTKAFTATRTAYHHMQMIGDPLAAAISKQFPEKWNGSSDSPAASLRVALNNAFREHVYLAARATGAALGGRETEFKAAAWALDANSMDIAKAIGSVYGMGAQEAFLPLWQKHIGFVVDYTTGLATKDKAKQDKAVTDLVQYTQDFGAFLSSANPNLPMATVADLVKSHVLTLKDVIDAQAAGNQVKVYTSLRSAMGHMQMIADPLAAAIVKQFPEKWSGSSNSPAASLRVALNNAFREHVYLAARATGAALGGRQAEFQAAAGALDANSVDISKAIGSVYGAGAQEAFLPLWRKHIGFAVDYTVGVATKDQAKQDKAVTDLVQYTQDFGAFLSSANPNLPKAVVADLVKSHVLTLKEVIDAQASGDQSKVYSSLRAAMAHMQMIADPLAEAIVKQFPNKYES